MALPNLFHGAAPIAGLVLLLALPAVAQDQPKVAGMTEPERLERCDNNRKRIPAIEREIQDLQPMGESVAQQMADDARDLIDIANESWIGPMQVAKMSQIAFRYGFDPRACLDAGNDLDACIKALDAHITRWADDRRADYDKRQQLQLQLKEHQTNLIALFCDTDEPEVTTGALNPAGAWSTTFGTMTLTFDSGTLYTGKYTYGDGRIDANLNGDRLVGYWIAPMGTERACERQRYGTEYYGRLEFTFDSNDNFTGNWGYCDDPPGEGKWQGQRNK